MSFNAHAVAILEIISDELAQNRIQLPDKYDTDSPQGQPPIYGGTYAELHDKIVEIMESEMELCYWCGVYV